jgi:hypothetical protein
MNDPAVYVLRIWRHAKTFRAALRPVTGVDVQVFHEPRRLVEFLAGSETDRGAAANGVPTMGGRERVRGGAK